MTHPRIDDFLKRIFDIREGEASRTILMTCFIFLVISSLMIVKPASSALFLSRLGASKLPAVFIMVAVLAAPISTIYAKSLKRLQLNHLIIRTLQASIVSLIVLWFLLHFGFLREWVLYIFYVWVAIFALVATSQFWILANQLFNAREAKRLFGFIGAGAIAGGIFGGYLTNLLAPRLGSESMLLVCGGLLSLCMLITKTVWRERPEQENADIARDDAPAPETSSRPLTLLKKSRLLAYMTCIVGISVVAAKLVEYQFSAIASARIADQDQLTAFFGFWFSNLNVVSLFIQLFATRRLVGYLGVGTSLLFLPGGILIGALAILITPALWSAVLIKVNEGSLKQSINKAGMELLAVSLPEEIKNQAKSFLDVFVDSFATGAGGLLLILFTHSLEVSVRQLSFLTVVLLAGWIYFVTRVRDEYVHSFRVKMEGHRARPQTADVDLEDKSVIEGLVTVLQGEDANQILHTLKAIKKFRNKRFIPSLKKLLRHPSRLIRREALQNIRFYRDDDFVQDVKQLVNDEDQEIKTEAIRYLFQQTPAAWQAELLEVYLQHEDYLIRGAALLCAARESKNNDDLKYIFKIKERVEESLLRGRGLDDSRQAQFTKRNCARVIGAANIPELYPHLHLLLKDQDAEVRRSAIISAGQTTNKEFIPAICRHLVDRELYTTARQALMNFGPGIIDILAHFINDHHEHREIRLSLPKVIAAMENQESVDVLIQNLGQEDLALRDEVLRALNRLRTSAPHLYFNEYRITNRIVEEAGDYAKTLAALQTEIKERVMMHSLTIEARSPIDEAKQNLKQTLQQRLDNQLERIFRLLGLIYAPQDIYNAYLSIRHGATDLKVNAVEFLDNVLDINLKKVIIPIVESVMAGALIEQTPHPHEEKASA